MLLAPCFVQKLADERSKRVRRFFDSKGECEPEVEWYDRQSVIFKSHRK